MNPSQFIFAYKVRQALNENLDKLPVATVDRLASARKMAVSSKKQGVPKRVIAARGKLAAFAGDYFNESISWVGRLGVTLPLIVLVSGLVMIYQGEQQQRIGDLAEIDALVLSDELPLSAYLDHGFNAYLAARER